MVSAPARRQQVEYARKRGLSCRRACALVRVARSSLRYKSRLATKDASVRARMCELAAQYPRYGYRRVRIFLGREGHQMGPDRAHRLWRQAGLQVPRRRPRRRVAASRPRPLPPTGPNHVWAYDFVFDTSATGQQIKCLTVVDEWTREALAIDVAGSIRAGRVIDVLARLVSDRGAPRYLRSDNGPEFVSSAILRWTTAEGIETVHIAPGKPWQNGTDESFNGPLPRGMPQHGVVPDAARGCGDHRDVAAALQRGPTPLKPRLFDTDRVQSEARGHQQTDRRGVFLASIGPKNPGRSHRQAPRFWSVSGRSTVSRDCPAPWTRASRRNSALCSGRTARGNQVFARRSSCWRVPTRRQIRSRTSAPSIRPNLRSNTSFEAL